MMMLLCFCMLSYMLSPCSAQVSGDVIDSVSDSDINSALQEVLNSYNYGNEVAVGLANTGGSENTFSYPRWYIDNCCNQAFPARIEADQTGLILFGSSQLTGPEGVFCYNIEGTSHMVCAAYSVPFNDVASKEAFNVKIYDTTVPVDVDMWEQMYNEIGGVWYPSEDGTRTRTEYGITVSASMTTGNSCSMIIKVDATEYDSSEPPELTYGCDVRPFYGNYCWRECHDVPPFGYCWLTPSCTSDGDCVPFGDTDTYPCDSLCYAA